MFRGNNNTSLSLRYTWRQYVGCLRERILENKWKAFKLMHHKSSTVVFSRLYLSNLGMIKGLVGYALWPYSLVGIMERTLSM